MPNLWSSCSKQNVFNIYTDRSPLFAQLLAATTPAHMDGRMAANLVRKAPDDDPVVTVIVFPASATATVQSDADVFAGAHVHIVVVFIVAREGQQASGRWCHQHVILFIVAAVVAAAGVGAVTVVFDVFQHRRPGRLQQTEEAGLLLLLCNEIVHARMSSNGVDGWCF